MRHDWCPAFVTYVFSRLKGWPRLQAARRLPLAPWFPRTTASLMFSTWVPAARWVGRMQRFVSQLCRTSSPAGIGPQAAS
jgi:hypothetical protein